MTNEFLLSLIQRVWLKDSNPKKLYFGNRYINNSCKNLDLIDIIQSEVSKIIYEENIKGKRFSEVIEFNIDNSDYFNFIKYYSIL